MNPIENLDPHQRTLLLVGAYLQHWALMESHLNSALAETLGLDGLPRFIVSKNTQLRDKIKIISTCIDARPDMRKADRLVYKYLFKKISDLSNDRNMVVHEMFSYDEATDGVSFQIVKAAGRFSSNNVVWKETDFVEKFRVLSAVTKHLSELRSKLEEISSITPAESASGE